jgi:diketogulonate reductase-like aldo/keto reductase
MAAVAVPARTLNDGRTLPGIGLGTWPMDDREAEAAVATAIELGYRLIDTAARYANERGVGRGIAASGLPREEVFVTTKLPGACHGYDEALASFERSRARLGLDYVDLFLIHWPLPRRDRYVDAWRALVKLREEGLARSIGVSNFTIAHLERVIEATGVVPAVNQVELHPRLAQRELRAWSEARGVVTQAYSPLGAGSDLLRDPAIAAIARAHGRTPAQVVLRWHVQLGTTPVPKSSDPGRMAENLDLCGFALSDADQGALAALDRGGRIGGDPETTEYL